jgi:hypothetical protein
VAASFPWGGRAAGKFEYKLTFKLIKTIFADSPILFPIKEYKISRIILIFGSNIWHIYFSSTFKYFYKNLRGQISGFVPTLPQTISTT